MSVVYTRGGLATSDLNVGFFLRKYFPNRLCDVVSDPLNLPDMESGWTCARATTRAMGEHPPRLNGRIFPIAARSRQICTLMYAEFISREVNTVGEPERRREPGERGE